jgi:CRP-like cAMP-binding protein
VTANAKADLLARVPLFSGMRGRDLEQVGQLAEEIDVPAGHVLTRQGTTGHEFFVIVEGQVAVEQDGKRLAVLGPGEFLGEIALIDERPRSATATCETACRLLVLGHREFHSLLMDRPDVQIQVLKALAHRVRQLAPEDIEYVRTP